MTISTWWGAAMRHYMDHGYLVIATTFPRRIGYRCTHVSLLNRQVAKLPQPFIVIAETTYEDYVSQWPDAKDRGKGKEHFYRIVTD